jgi:hypothetical protein
MALTLAVAPAFADGGHDHGDGPGGGHRADGHAPIGVMGDHMHKKGEVMFSYRYMRMEMDGNRIGTDGVSPTFITTTVANPFAPPPTLRVVPTEMTMEMHMLGAMYAPTDWLTLMAMGMYVDKEMDHLTFAAMSPTTQIGTFTTRSNGIGDTSVTGLVRLYEDDTHHLHANVGLSLPTGSITEEDRVFSPLATTPTLRLPYAMQLGSGTFDALPGLTYTGTAESFSWGSQWTSRVHLGRNDQGYTLGDWHQLTAWAAKLWAPWISTSLRLTGRTQDDINGFDTRITAPVTTANPSNYGGQQATVGLGVNLIGQSGILAGHRLAVEAELPIHRDLNGPQMETDWTLTIGWQKSF